jgi:hypothetical protein
MARVLAFAGYEIIAVGIESPSARHELFNGSFDIDCVMAASTLAWFSAYIQDARPMREWTTTP